MPNVGGRRAVALGIGADGYVSIVVSLTNMGESTAYGMYGAGVIISIHDMVEVGGY